jgi:hypothetical protein
MRIDELRDALRHEADRLGGTEPLVPQVRADRIVRHAESSGARRRGSVGAVLAVAAVAAVAAIVVVPPLLPVGPAPDTAPLGPMVQAPPKLAGYVLPQKISVREVTYQYERSEQVDQRRHRLLLAIGPAEKPRVLGWSTTAGTTGQVVVSMDGEMVSRSPAGGFEYGIVLSAGDTHLVAVRATKPVPGREIGVAIYGPERF